MTENEGDGAVGLRLQQLAGSFNFPPTPDVTNIVHQGIVSSAKSTPWTFRFQGLLGQGVWAVVLVALALLTLLAVPQVRAAVLRFFQVGAITLFEIDERDILGAEISAEKPAQLPLVDDEFVHEVSLAEARERLPHGLYLPGKSSGLGAPDQIFLFEEPGWPETAVMIWQDAPGRESPRLALYQIEMDQFASKGATLIKEIQMDGQRAVWVEGPHLFRLRNGRFQEWQVIESPVLIWWSDAGITFRLEGARSIEEAVMIAGSLARYEE